MLLDPAVGSLIVIAVGLLFAVGAIHKLRDLALFAHVFAAYRMLPDSAARRLAWLIPCAELAIAAALALPMSRHAAVIGAIGLLAAYAVGLALNLARGRRDLDCGCAAAGNRRSIAPWMVWRNLFLILCLGIAALPWSSRPLSAADVLTIAAGLMAIALLYAAIDRLFGDVSPRARALTQVAS
jgi:hypothetical protein